MNRLKKVFLIPGDKICRCLKSKTKGYPYRFKGEWCYVRKECLRKQDATGLIARLSKRIYFAANDPKLSYAISGLDFYSFTGSLFGKNDVVFPFKSSKENCLYRGFLSLTSDSFSWFNRRHP